MLRFILVCAILYLVTNKTDAEIETISGSREVCNSDELNHSVLVECNITRCGLPETNLAQIWPTKMSKLLHVYSSRAGARFEQVELLNLDYEEDATAKLFDINTTLTVFNKIRNPERNRLLGFGATLNATKILGDLEKSYGLVLDDLLGELPSSARLNILRLALDASSRYPNLSKTLQDIDQHVAHSRNYNTQKAPLKILLDVKADHTQQADRSSLFEIIRATAGVLENLSSVEIWAIALDHAFISSDSGQNQDYYDLIRKYLPSTMIVASAPLAAAPNFVDRSAKSTKFQGLLLRGQQSTPYNVLEYLSTKTRIELILSVGSNRRKTRDYGDWENAQAHAVELLKHLKYGSMGFIEDLSVIEVLDKEEPNQDSSLYNLHASHQTHFRGPMFYATGHFSRYLPPGSEPLEVSVFTQPNMFSAHYAAYKTPNNHIVAIILNSNDHLLPFRLEVDNKIVAHTSIEAKSFNTIILKL